MYLKSIAIVLSFLSLSYSTIPEKLLTPGNSRNSIIAVSVLTKAPIPIFKLYANMVYFVKVNKPDDMYKSDSLICSNYSDGKYVYLIDAEPGTYVIVGVESFSNRNSYTMFTENQIKSSRFDVKPGELVFLGNYIVQDHPIESGEYKEVVQKHYYKQVDVCPNPNGKSRLWLINKGDVKDVKKGVEFSSEFIIQAKKVFSKTGWASLVERMKK